MTGRIIREASSYMVTEDAEVWSLPRTVPGKLGSTRTLKSKQIKPDQAGRVSLSSGGRVERFSVEWLHRRYWTELHYPKCQALCRAGHTLMGPGAEVAVWGCGNRVCLRCWPDWSAPEAVGRRHHKRPGRPRKRAVGTPGHPEVAELLVLGHGYTVETFSRADTQVFPRIVLVPDHLGELAELMQKPPEGTPWGAGIWTPGCVSPAPRLILHSLPNDRGRYSPEVKSA